MLPCNKHVSTSAIAGRFPFQRSNAAAARLFNSRYLGPAVFLMFLLLFVGQTRAAAQRNMDSASVMDARWSAWIGSWRLIPDDAADKKNGAADSQYILDIRPGSDKRSVVMKGIQNDAVLFDQEIAVDGSRQPIEDESCKGWHKYSWSDTGKRLLFESESECADRLKRKISGISFFNDPGEWADIQLLSSGEDRVVTIRRYRQADGDSAAAVRGRRFNTAQIIAGTNFSIDEIIELTGKMPPEAIEAALVEMQKPFKINGKALERLADSGVAPQVIDLMVALSFPDKFTVEEHSVKPLQAAEERRYSAGSGYYYSWSPFGIWPFYDPLSPWYWNTYGYGHYGYWGWGSLGGYYYPYWGPSGGGGADPYIGGGRLVAGEGYTRVRPNNGGETRYAHPRGNSIATGRAAGSNNRSAPGNASSSGGHVAGSGNSGGSSSSGSASAPSSSGGAPSASPGGYSSGGRGSGTAHPRQ